MKAIHRLSSTAGATSTPLTQTGKEVHSLFSLSAELAVTTSRAYTLSILSAAVTGVLIGMLAIEAFGSSKDRLLIRMWERTHVTCRFLTATAL